MTFNAQKHWENIYQSKQSKEVSWFQERPAISLRLIAETGLNKEASIIDVGGGDSTLVDALLERGFENITVLDISSTALQKAKQRLGDKAAVVTWLMMDIRELETAERVGRTEGVSKAEEVKRYDLWHDRAVLHFLTEKEDITKYLERVRQLLKPNGYLIVSTFSLNGPKKCSGLDVWQYSEDSMKKLFSDFEHIKSFEEEHLTPWGASQVFIYSMFRQRA